MLIDKSKDALLADPGNAVFIKIPVVKPGEKYRISARVMVEDVTPGAAVELTVRWREKDRRTWVNFMSMWNTVKLVPKPGKWADLTIYVAVPAIRSVGAMHITLGTARSVKGGKFWFDDVKISKLGLKR
jgi:hypothetical protein